MREKVEWMNCLRVTCARGCANLDGILDEDAFVYGGKADLVLRDVCLCEGYFYITKECWNTFRIEL